jgi:uncharacterized protein YbbC (DUF1343 family)
MVRLGSDLLLASSRLKGARVGIVCNHASLDRGFPHIVDRLAAAPDVTLAAIFGPQHGFRSDVQDNMIETPHADDPARRVRVIVCDRPNPIGGTDVEGALLVEGFESFVGQFPIPMRHGMTIGELARLFNEHFAIGASLEIVQMEGWRREMFSDATDLPWVMPSPNIPTLDTAIVYPGTVLFEGILISEGRGTTRPFELIGAPWIEAESFARQMNALKLPGAYFRPAVFEPTFQKHAKQTCGGCQIHVTDRQQFQPVLVGVALIAMFHQVDPARFAWRQPPYEYEHDKMPIDILAGSATLRGQIESGTSARDIAASWKKDEESFRKLREPYLLY